MTRRDVVSALPVVVLGTKPNKMIPCPIPGCDGKTFIVGQHPRLVHCWECACNKCGVLFVHNKYLEVKP